MLKRVFDAAIICPVRSCGDGAVWPDTGFIFIIGLVEQIGNAAEYFQIFIYFIMGIDIDERVGADNSAIVIIFIGIGEEVIVFSDIGIGGAHIKFLIEGVVSAEHDFMFWNFYEPALGIINPVFWVFRHPGFASTVIIATAFEIRIAFSKFSFSYMLLD